MPGNHVTVLGRVVPKAPCPDQLLPPVSRPSPFLLPLCTPAKEEHLVLQPTISAPPVIWLRFDSYPLRTLEPSLGSPRLSQWLPPEVLITLHSYFFYPGLIKIWCE